MKLNHNVYAVGKTLSQRKPEFPLSPTCMNNQVWAEREKILNQPEGMKTGLA